jgi:hypothetical protein
MPTLASVHRLRSCLNFLEPEAGVARLEVIWLRLRCEDTLAAEEEGRRSASLRQLQRDVTSFDAEFPGFLPGFLVDQVAKK